MTMIILTTIVSLIHESEKDTQYTLAHIFTKR